MFRLRTFRCPHHNSLACISGPFSTPQGGVVQCQNDIGAIPDQGKHRLARPVSLVIAAVERVLQLLALAKTIEAADHVVAVLIVKGRAVGHEVEIPTLEHGKRAFDEQLMEVFAVLRLEGQGPELDGSVSCSNPP